VILGTFGYMSPEQVTGEHVDARSDLFALGCVIHEMVSGRPKFGGGTPQEVIAQLLNDSGPDASAAAIAPPELGAIVARCTARQPARRFDSASDLGSALRALLTGSMTSASGSESKRSRAKGKSLAVLPFVNAGADPSTEYLTDGISENIINSLSQLEGLRVVPRSLVFRYKGLQADPATIGLTLNARTILTGRVSQQGDYLIIQAELVDTTTESQLWGEQFRPKLTDLANVQQEIAWQISEALRLKLTGAQKKRLRKRATVNPEAYQEYLRGRYFLNAWSPEAFRRALEHFERSIEHDPTYAPAYAGLGDTLGSMSYYGFITAEDGFPRAQAAAERAVALDPDLADAHSTLALGAIFHRWNWEESERHFRQSIKLNPKLASARAFYALLLASAGRHDEALAQARAGREIDPLSPLLNMSVGWVLYFAGRCEEAVTELMRTLELHRGDAADEPHSVVIAAYELLGRFQDAARVASAHAMFGIPVSGAALLQAWQAEGAPGYWKERLAALDRAADTALPMIHYNYASVLTQLGREQEAVDHIRTLVEMHHGSCVFFGVEPAFRGLHDRPDFDALLARIDVPRTVGAAPRSR
jgi:TolB-like protein